MAFVVRVRGNPLDPADLPTIQSAIDVTEAKILANYKNLQEGFFLIAGRPNFWDEAGGPTYRDALARFHAVAAEFKRIHEYLLAAKNAAEFQHRPRGDENAVTRRVTNADIRQRVTELNTAIAHRQATEALFRNHLYSQHAGYIGNVHGQAPPAGAKIVHIEGTTAPQEAYNGETEDEMEGRGLIDNEYQAAKHGFADLKSKFAPTVNTNLAEHTNEIIDKFNISGYYPSTLAFLRTHGSEDITSLAVRRAPIRESTNTALDMISMGTWNKTRHDIGYDKMFHLALIVNGRYAIQRIGRISVGLKDTDRPGSEYMSVPLKNEGYGDALTMRKMLQTTRIRIGHDAFFKYDSFANNCQNFVMENLSANGLLTPNLQQFIHQPLDELLKQQPEHVSTVARTITNVGHIFGLGKPHDGASDEEDMDHGMPYVQGVHRAFSEDDIRKLCGDIPVLRYPELATMTDPAELFKGKVGAALLFLTEGHSDGHWIAVLDKPDHHEVFDSFGTAIDGDRKWLDKKHLLEFHETAPLLSILLQKSKKRIIHNTKKLQDDHADTCGRYVAARIVRAETPLHQFVHELTSNGRSPDENVTLMTQSIK